MATIQTLFPAWPFLSQGSQIALVAPSALLVQDSRPLPERVEASLKIIANVVEAFRQLGLRAKFYGVLEPSSSYQGYYAASSQARAAALAQALEDPTVDAVLAMRGGFGAMDVLTEWEKEGKNPFQTSPLKPLIGFSDTTYLLNQAALNKWPTLHAPGGNSCARQLSPTPDKTEELPIMALYRVLVGETPILTYEWTSPIPHHMPPNFTLTGSVIGGNLSVLQRNAGTATSVEAAQQFVFIEDTEVDPKRQLDLFIHMIRSGGFGTPEQPTQAILLGHTPLTPNPGQSHATLLEETIQTYQRHLKNYDLNIPILYNPCFGHGPINHVLPLGTKATLSFPPNSSPILTVSTNQSAY